MALFQDNANRDLPAKAKYLEIYDKLRERIEQGPEKAGSLLPTEKQLCAEYGVSRNTVRQALSLLDGHGFIERRRRAGTRIRTQEVGGVLRHATGSRSDFLRFISETYVTFSDPAHVKTDLPLARLLGCDELRQWQLIEGVRYEVANDRPIGLVKLYIDTQRAIIPPGANFGRRPVVEWLERHHGIRPGRLSQDISAVNLSEFQAEALEERANSASLRIIRRYFDVDEKIFQISVTVYRSTDFGYNLQADLREG